MFSLFKKPAKPKHDPVFVFAKLNAKVMPFDRGDRFEDPLDKAIKKAGFGEVTGGGTGQQPTGEIDHSGIDIDVVDIEQGIPFITATLDRLGAPKGSQLEYEHKGQTHTVPFGSLEGIGIYLNGTDLPPEVYEKSDINVVIETINKLLKGRGSAQDFWEGPSETALYLYGPSADAMLAAVQAFIASEPLCQKARVVRIA